MFESDLKHPKPSLQDKLHQLYTLDRDKTIDLSFRPPFLNLLERLGNPHLNLPPVIHVAGTNGKGSTIATMRAILEAAGKRVHVYTSPHLIKFNERLMLAGEEISDAALEPLIDEVLEANQGGAVTFFEITTAMAFLAFSRTSADYTLLEVGLGGRLDCTNIIDRSTLSVITKLSLDHTEFLGNTIAQIAGEKAGIIKAGTPCIVGAQEPEAITVIEQKAQEMDAPLIKVDKVWPDDLPPPTLTGAHQLYNAKLAIKAMETLKISRDAIAQGLQNIRWRARLQKLSYSPAPDFELWLDGGHNADAAHALKAQIDAWQAQDDKPLYLILGMMAHKDPRRFVAPLLNTARSIHTLDIPYEKNCLKAAMLTEMFPDHDFVQGDTLHGILQHLGTQPSGRIVIAGSLYLAGHVLEQLES